MTSSPFVPFDAFWLATACALTASAGALARLRRAHEPLWRELGSPRFLPSPGAEGLRCSAALSRFYWSRRVAGLGDPCLVRWVVALRAAQLALAGVVAALAYWVAAGPG